MNDEKKVGDVCLLEDGVTEGVLADTSEAKDGSALTCVAKESNVDADAEAKAKADADAAAEAEAAAKAAEDAAAAASGEEVVAPKEGDACTTPEGTPGTLSKMQDDSFTCVAVPQPGEACTTPDGRAGTVDADGVCLVNSN